MNVISDVSMVIKDREKVHGNPKANHENIAALWSAFLVGRNMDDGLSATDVALMMALLKIARTKVGEYNRDDYIDLCGYGALACELSGPGIVETKSSPDALPSSVGDGGYAAATWIGEGPDVFRINGGRSYYGGVQPYSGSPGIVRLEKPSDAYALPGEPGAYVGTG